MQLFKGGEGYMDAREEYNKAFRRMPNGAVVPMFPGDEMSGFNPGRPNPNAHRVHGGARPRRGDWPQACPWRSSPRITPP